MVVRPDPSHDRPRWAVIAGVTAGALALGVLWPRACGIRFSGEGEEPATSASVSAEPTTPPPTSATTPNDAGLASSSDAGVEIPSLASVLVAKSTLMHCQDPPAAELKPSKCGEHGLDPQIVPRIEQLATCPAVAGVTGKLALSVDLDFKKQALKVVAGKGSGTNKNGRRDDKAIEPLLQCVRTSLKELFTQEAKYDHVRYVLAYAVTISANAAPSPAVAGSVSEKSVTGVATVQVDTAIVRDPPNTTGQPIGRLARGTKVTAIGTSGNWFHVKFGENDAQEGWIFRTNIGK